MSTTSTDVDALRHEQDPALAFLAQAGRVVGATLDYRRTLQGLAEIGLGVLGDFCLVGVLDDAGVLRIMAGAHIERDKRRIVDALRDVTITNCSETAAVVRSGRPRALAAIDDERLREAFDCEALSLVRELDPGPTLIVPLVLRRQRIGVLIFSRPRGCRPYEAGDVSLAEEFARRAAAAVDNARAFSHTSDVAHTLQQRLLPPGLPRIPGIELAAEYQPAGQHVEVGGDFYDAFPVRDNTWGLLIGDVAGKGPAAAATTAVVRYTARAASRFGSRLGVAAAVNEALLEMEDGEGFCTMTYAELRLDPDTIALSIINCGHPAPLLVSSKGDIQELGGHGSLLGLFPDVAVESQTFELRSGDTVVFVTDGVLEARAPRRDDEEGGVELFDHEGLARTVAAGAGEPAAVVARRIQEAALAFAGGSPGDDLATLVLRVLKRPRGGAHAG